MTLRKDFENHNYGCVVKFVLTQDWDKVIKPIYKKAGIKEQHEESEGEVVVINSNLIYLVINQKYFSWNTIFHEVYHLTSAICELRNIIDEESKSWTAGWIGGKLSEYFKLKKLEPNCG
jgi:hypothetical protein